MSALSPREAERLAKFIARLLSPIEQGAHVGVAKACLASKVRWQPDDLAFLRSMVVQDTADRDDWARLQGLVDYGRESAR